ncbi:MAG: hypothetical protein U1F87_16555 [Kiritimatiellia bacterium]
MNLPPANAMQILQRLLPVLLLSLCPPPAGAEDHPATLVTGLRCEGHIDPLGLDIPRPRLGWRMETDRNGAAQTAYQIEVDGAWDSGRVASDASVAIPYAGTPLASGKTYSWRVRLWDEQGRPTAWSAPARWTMGKLAPSDWSARWIAAPADIPPAVEGVEIVRATYRTLDGKVEVDVTPSVRKLIGEKRLAVSGRAGLAGRRSRPVRREGTGGGLHPARRARTFTRPGFRTALHPRGPAGVPAPWFRGNSNWPPDPPPPWSR